VKTPSTEEKVILFILIKDLFITITELVVEAFASTEKSKLSDDEFATEIIFIYDSGFYTMYNLIKKKYAPEEQIVLSGKITTVGSFDHRADVLEKIESSNKNVSSIFDNYERKAEKIFDKEFEAIFDKYISEVEIILEEWKRVALKIQSCPEQGET